MEKAKGSCAGFLLCLLLPVICNGRISLFADSAGLDSRPCIGALLGFLTNRFGFRWRCFSMKRLCLLRRFPDRLQRLPI